MLALLLPPVSLLLCGRTRLGVLTTFLWPMGSAGIGFGAGVPLALAHSVPGQLSLAFTTDPAFIPMAAIGVLLLVGSTIAAITASHR